jgi:hypothetical protein
MVADRPPLNNGMKNRHGGWHREDPALHFRVDEQILWKTTTEDLVDLQDTISAPRERLRERLSRPT